MKSIAILRFLATEERQFKNRKTGEVETSRTIIFLDGSDTLKFTASKPEHIGVYEVIKAACKPMSFILVEIETTNYYIAETGRGGKSMKITGLLETLPVEYAAFVGKAGKDSAASAK